MLSIIIAMTAFGLALLVFAMFILSYPSLKHAATLRNSISSKSINLHIPTSNHMLRLLGLHIEKVLVEGRRFLVILKNDKVLTALLFGIIIFGVMVIGLMAILAIYLFY